MLDINYLMFTSLNGDTRQENLDDFFDAYYANFASILAAGNQAIRFTLPMLKEEFHSKNLFGLLMGTSLVPMILMESDDIPDLSELSDDKIQEAMAAHKEKIMGVVQTNPLLTTRFLSMFDDLKVQGLFDSVLSE